MIRFGVTVILLVWICCPASAASFDNESGQYVLSALPDAEREARRMDRQQLCDQQPAGLMLRKGERVSITVRGLGGNELAAMVGFRPMWGVELDQQEQPLIEGDNVLAAEQDGPLFFRFIEPKRAKSAATVTINVRGGRPLPLYVDGTMSSADWAEELDAHADAPFVQLFGEQAMITLPSSVHADYPVDDPGATFATINEMLDLQNELAGFDGKTARDQKTQLRMHYLVDFRVSKADRESFYMYATDQFIGMLDDNSQELTDPDQLRREWGIWHETGHTHQQNSWTWGALTEVNVNLFSLYVQESFGQPSRLSMSEDDQPSTLDKARDYLENGANNMLDEVEGDDGDEFFIRLVMFHQLKEVYGWDLFKDLHKHFRASPLPEDASDQDKADAFVLAMCELTGVDLRPFFETWGLQASRAANNKIDEIGYELPEDDLTQIF